MRFGKLALAAAVGLAYAVPSYSAQQVGGVTIDGWVLFESWIDKHNRRDTQMSAPATEETTAFVLHNVNFSGAGKLVDAGPFTNWSWKIGNRGRNGNLSGTGSLGNREAWLGFDGDYGSVKFGRFLLKGWEVLDWPYGSPAWQAEALAETGANWASVTRAVRYNAPRIADALDIEFTHDVETTTGNGKASLNELFVRYSAGPVTFDGVYELIKDSPISKGNSADGVYGGASNDSTNVLNEGALTGLGNKQTMAFLGARWNMGAGFESVLAYKKNKWHSATAGGLGGLACGCGEAATPGTDVENGRVLLGLNYTTGKWQYNAAFQRVLPGKDNVAGDLKDGAKIIGGRAIREVGKGAMVYVGIRHTKFDSDRTPIDSKPWQVQSDAAWTAPKSNTRIGIGGQVFF